MRDDTDAVIATLLVVAAFVALIWAVEVWR
jgi:hypothetical protein